MNKHICDNPRETVTCYCNTIIRYTRRMTHATMSWSTWDGRFTPQPIVLNTKRLTRSHQMYLGAVFALVTPLFSHISWHQKRSSAIVFTTFFSHYFFMPDRWCQQKIVSYHNLFVRDWLLSQLFDWDQTVWLAWRTASSTHFPHITRNNSIASPWDCTVPSTIF